MSGMTNTRWWTYVNQLIGDASYSAAAEKAGFDKSAFTRWKKGARADPEFVVKMARAYKVNVLEALVEAEFITDAEASLTEVAPDLDITKIPGSDLMDEIERRLEILRYLDSLDAPEDEVAKRRAKKSNSTPRTVSPVWDGDGMPPDAVADDSEEVGGTLDDLDP